MALDSIDGVQGVPGFPDAIDRTTGDGDDARVRTPGPAVVRTDLAGYVRQRGVLDLARAATLGAQIAGQLNESHAFALTHGVLRPDTVFVDRVDGGLAVSLSAPGAQPTGLAYLAPEIIEGEPATAAADLYSLGCLIWFMVAGAPPFRGTPEQVAEQQVTADAPHLPGTIPSVVALNALLTRLMAKDPGLRPSADEAAAALDHIVAVAEPSDITEPPLPASAQASADLNAVAPERRGPGRRGVLVGAAATAAAALGLWGISTAMTRGGAERDGHPVSAGVRDPDKRDTHADDRPARRSPHRDRQHPGRQRPSWGGRGRACTTRLCCQRQRRHRVRD